MSQILNVKERGQAFWKFLFFFLLSVIMIAGALYFNFQVPEKENSVLRDQLERVNIQRTAQDKFLYSMEEAKVLLDSINKPNVDNLYLNQMLTARLRELNDLQYKDSSMYSRMNKQIVNVFLDLKNAKNTLSELQDAPRQLIDLRSQLTETKTKLDQAERDLDNFRKAYQ